MEKFEFYGAPDLEREMTEGIFGKPTLQQKLHKKAQQMHKAGVAQGKERHKKLVKMGAVKPKPTLGQKLKAGVKMVFGKPRKVEDIEVELAILETSSSPFPEVRERRIQELRAELKDARPEVE